MNLLRRTGRGRLRLSLITLAAAGTTLVIAACGSSPAASSASLSSTNGSSGPYTLTYGSIGTSGTGSLASGLGGTLGFAASKGLLQQWLKSDAITLNVAQFANGPLLTAAMVGGSVQLGDLGDTPALIAYSQGLQARLVAQADVGQAAWIVAQPSITSLSQLAGKTIARQQASYMDRYLQGLLAEKDLLSQVRLVAMLSAQSVPAFEAGSLDAIVIEPTQWPELEKTGRKYNILAESETTPSLQGTGLAIISDKELAAHPDLPGIFNTLRVKALTYAEANASAYYSWAAALGDTTVALEKLSSPLSDDPVANFTTAGIKQLQGTLNFLVSEKEAKSFSIQSWEIQSDD
jgi:sulfonate transport system substrate-binding protein